jgi:hypothetical protein
MCRRVTARKTLLADGLDDHDDQNEHREDHPRRVPARLDDAEAHGETLQAAEAGTTGVSPMGRVGFEPTTWEYVKVRDLTDT